MDVLGRDRSRPGTRAQRGEALLEVADLETRFETRQGTVRAVKGVSLSVRGGEFLGLVGESGSGKSMTALSIMRLVPPQGRIVSGSVRFKGVDLLGLPEAGMAEIRGDSIAMVFQDAMTALNPLIRVGEQIAETIRAHRRISRAESARRAGELMARVGIPSPRERASNYPHQFSGGMAQRVMIATALANEPELIIADEPTTALDATTQAQILELLLSLNRESGTAIVLITHNLGIVAGFCERVVVMYAGSVVEEASTDSLFANPIHPYTRGLLASVPLPTVQRHERLHGIAGSPPDLARLPAGCAFFERCPEARPRCEHERPPLLPLRGDPSHRVASWLAQTEGPNAC